MRFLILSQYFPPEPGAAQGRLAALARQLKDFGHQVEVVTSLPNYPCGRIFPEYRGSAYKHELWDGIPVHHVWTYASQGAGLRRLFNYGSFAVASFTGLLKSKRPDYIFVESPPLSIAIPAFLSALAWRSPVIFNVSDLWPDSIVDLRLMREGWLIRRARNLEQSSYHHARYVCAVTEGIRDGLLGKGVPPEKILFLPNGVDVRLFTPTIANEKLRQKLGLVGKHVILFAGTHSYAQNLDCVLHAANILRRHSTIHFLFVGSGSAKPDLLSLAERLQLLNVTFLDPVPQNQVPELLSISLCGLVCLNDTPILYTARPAKALAIMACAKPVLFVAGENARHPIQDAAAGITVSIHRPEEVAKAIQFLAANPEISFRFGQNGRRYVVDNLSWSKLVAEFLQQLALAELQQ